MFRKDVYKIEFFPLFIDEDCKKRWRSIKDTYKRMVRQGKLDTGSTASTKRPKWPLANLLTFLNLVPFKRR
jgi:hypothetical protein